MSSVQGSPTEADLGALLSRHRARRGLAVFYSLFTILLVGSSLAAIILGLSEWNFAYENYGPALVWRWSATYFGAALVLAIPAFLMLVVTIRLLGLVIRAYQAGMVRYRWWRRDVFLWRQIRWLSTSVASYGLPSLASIHRIEITIRASDGRRLHLTDSLTDLRQLADTLKHHVYPRLLTECRLAVEQGHTLAFGRLLLTPRGVQKGRTTLDWESVEKVSLSRGQLRIQGQAGETVVRIRVPVNKVPNVELCAQLIRNLGSHEK